MNAATLRKFLLFGLAGGAGFVVDAGIAYLLVDTPLGFYGARVISFLCAVATTWIINRSLAFKAQRGDHLPVWREFLHYLVAMLLGGAVNVGVSFALYAWFHPSRELSVLCVAAGVLAGMFVNFLLADKLVFRSKPTTPV
jgi:putative flippase GtrA